MSISPYNPLAFDIQILLMSNYKALPCLVIYKLLLPKDNIPRCQRSEKKFCLRRAKSANWIVPIEWQAFPIMILCKHCVFTMHELQQNKHILELPCKTRYHTSKKYSTDY